MSAANTVLASRKPDFSTIIACGQEGRGVFVTATIEGHVLGDRSVLQISIEDPQEADQESKDILSSHISADVANLKPKECFDVLYPLRGKNGAVQNETNTFTFSSVKVVEVRATMDEGVTRQDAVHLITRVCYAFRKHFPNAEFRGRRNSEGSCNYFLAASVALIACAIAYHAWSNGPLDHGA